MIHIRNATETERTHGRLITRFVQAFPALPERPFTLWAGLAAIVVVERVVERSGVRRGKSFAETAYYITSHRASAEVLAALVRNHWQIENGLHWVKDVQMKEDACTTREGQAPRNLALVRSIVLTLFRRKGVRSVTTARRNFAHNVLRLWRFVEGNRSAQIWGRVVEVVLGGVGGTTNAARCAAASHLLQPVLLQLLP